MARAKEEAQTTERAREWAMAKAIVKKDIAMISSKVREKVDPEAEATEREREK